MTIYLVIGDTGEYEDRRKWVTKCFIDKNTAESYLKLYQNYADNHPLDKNGEIDYYNTKWITNSPDQFFKSDYTGTNYSIIERELVTDDFMKEILLTKKD